MQRIKPLNPEGNDQLAATYMRITETRGYVSAILMSLSHTPAGLEAFAKYGEYVRYGTELPGRVRELSVLAIATGNQYAWSHHHPHAIKAGVTQQELDSLESGGALSDTISAPEQAAIRYAREFGQGGKVTDETFAEARRYFSERQITDLTLLCGYFMALDDHRLPRRARAQFHVEGKAGLTVRHARAAAVALIFCASASVGYAQTYPVKQIRIVVPFAPGGGTDILTRIMLPKLTELLKQQLIVDNRPGAGSQIGTDLVAKAPGDGHTVLMVDTAFMTNPSLYSKLPYNSERDFAPVSLAATAPVIMIVHPSMPVRTVKELVSLARAQPGALNFASGGPGSSTHLGVELLKYVAKIDLVHIPYKGTGPAVADMLGGQVTMMFAGISSVKQHVEGGRLRAIAVTGEKRSPATPTVPTFGETGMSAVDASSYWGALAPARTPQDVVNRLSTTMAQVLKMPDVREKLVELGFDPIGGGPSEFAALLAKETDKWAKVIKAAGVKLD